MASMEEKMKERAIPAASSVKMSNEIVKTINRADVVELNRTLEPIIRQNHQQLRESWEEAHDKIVGSN